MGTKTEAEFVRNVLEDLIVASPSQSISEQAYASVQRRIAPMIETLNQEDVGFIQFTPEDGIDDALFLPFSNIMAFACCKSFGVVGPERDRLQQEAEEAKSTIREVLRLHGTNQVLTPNYIPFGRRY